MKSLILLFALTLQMFADKSLVKSLTELSDSYKSYNFQNSQDKTIENTLQILNSLNLRYNDTSLNSIAKITNANKPEIVNYESTKTELCFRCIKK